MFPLSKFVHKLRKCSYSRTIFKSVPTFKFCAQRNMKFCRKFKKCSSFLNLWKMFMFSKFIHKFKKYSFFHINSVILKLYFKFPKNFALWKLTYFLKNVWFQIMFLLSKMIAYSKNCSKNYKKSIFKCFVHKIESS